MQALLAFGVTLVIVLLVAGWTWTTHGSLHGSVTLAGVCRDMAAALCVAGFPLTSGKAAGWAAGWAAGIVYSVGWVNFIGDPSQPYHMRAEEMAPAVGVSPATLMNRARDIREGLGLNRIGPRWSTKARLERNPLLRTAEVLADLASTR